MDSVSSLDIAIFSKLNELGKRFGLKGHETEAVLEMSEETATQRGVTYLRFINATDCISPATEKPEFKQMLKLLGAKQGRMKANTAIDIEDLLDAALQKAPRGRAL